MSNEQNHKDEQISIVKVVGIAVGLPSSILGIFFVVYFLIEKGHIPAWLGMMFIIIIIVYLFYLMVRNVYKKK